MIEEHFNDDESRIPIQNEDANNYCDKDITSFRIEFDLT